MSRHHLVFLVLSPGEWRTFPASDSHQSKVYRIESGLDSSIEVAFDFESTIFTKAFMLSTSDRFKVPRRNSYRIWNHSKTKDAVLSSTTMNKEEALEEWEGEDILASSTKKNRHGRKSR